MCTYRTDIKVDLYDLGPPIPTRDAWRPAARQLAIFNSDCGRHQPRMGRKARAAAVSLSNEDIFDEPSFGVMVLQDVCAIFEGENAQRLSSKTIVDQLVAMPERPWSEWRRGQGLNQNSLARLLKPFGVKSKMIRFAPKPANPLHGYEAGAIREAKLRFAEHSGEEGEGAGPEPI